MGNHWVNIDHIGLFSVKDKQNDHIFHNNVIALIS